MKPVRLSKLEISLLKCKLSQTSPPHFQSRRPASSRHSLQEIFTMRCLLFLAFLLAVEGQFLILREDNNQCPPKNGQYSHPQYCDKFLNCWDGKATEGQCSNGLNFNPETSSCDYPKNVDCMGKADSRPPEGDASCSKEPYGTFAGSNCNEFIVCHASNASVFRCPDMHSYDKELGVCVQDSNCTPPPPAADTPAHVPPTQVINPDIIRPLPPNGPDGEDEASIYPVIPSWPPKRCPIRTGFIPENDCHKVLVCIAGTGYEVDCKNEFFHPSEGKCKPERSPLCPTLYHYVALPQLYLFK